MVKDPGIDSDNLKKLRMNTYSSAEITLITTQSTPKLYKKNPSSQCVLSTYTWTRSTYRDKFEQRHSGYSVAYGGFRIFVSTDEFQTSVSTN